MRIFIFSGAAIATSLLTMAASAQQAATLSVEPAALVDQLEATLGKFEGYRRANAKGICATGEFVGTEAGRKLSIASAFSGKAIPAVVRFSVGGANPNAPDNTKSQRNLSLQLNLPSGEQWQMGNISSPMFSAATPKQFLALLTSRQPDPATKQPDPAKVKAFNEANPEVLLQGKYFASQPVPASFASVNFWGVNAFGFVDAKGKTQYGKWIFEPTSGVQGLSDDEAKAKGPAFLFDDLRQRVKNGSVSFAFNLELAEPGDVIDNALIPLPAGRTKVNIGMLKITAVSDDASGACLTTTFNPLVLPKGVVASADPILPARATPYIISLGRRLSEGAKQ